MSPDQAAITAPSRMADASGVSVDQLKDKFRNAIAMRAMPQQTDMPPPPVDRQLAPAPPAVTTDIKPMPQMAPPPPPSPPMAPPPPAQMAQASSVPAPGYITPEQPPPMPPKPSGYTPEERRMMNIIAANPNNEYVAKRYAPALAIEKQNREAIDAQQMKQYEADIAQHRELVMKREGQRETASERIQKYQAEQQDLAKRTVEANVAARTGGLGNEALLAPVIKSQEKVAGLPATTQAIRNARDLISQGTFSGAGAEQKLAVAKAKQAVAAMFGYSADDPRIATTEAYRSVITPLVSAARSATAGNANISDADIKLALAGSGGDINLDAKTFPKVLDAIERINLGLAIGHQGRVTAAAAGNETAAQALHGVYGLPMEDIIPDRFKQRLRDHPDTAAEFDKTFKTPGLARKILGQ
jgi:hypothetical protein